MDRRLQPELLDTLPANDALARASRRDLRRINACMRNPHLAAVRLIEIVRHRPPSRIVDLGAGDGSFLLSLTQRLPALAPGTELVLVDRCNVVDEGVLVGLRSRGFCPLVEQADAWEWLRAMPEKSGTWVVTNLFLHHFTADELRAGFEVVAGKAEACCACEPCRATWPLVACHLLWLIGANVVTRHDAEVSVRAGFAGQELSALWPVAEGWRLHEGGAGVFSHLFLAERTTVAAAVGS